MSAPEKNTALAKRVASLAQAAELAQGRSSQDAVNQGQRVAQQVDRRLAFLGNDTVIALVGATGSGKSSLFNAISGTTLAEPGLKRPTTSKAMAAYWGSELPNDLLDWLEVPRRHLVRGDDPGLNGLILLDMPDHDSTQATHRLEVDRLVALVDQMIWVVDPQKYADAALHNNYLKPLADHAEVMMVVLNQADRLTPGQLRSATRDLRRLLDGEGLSATGLVSASALTGQGIESLRKTITTMVKSKRLAAKRLSADVDAAAKALLAELGGKGVEGLPPQRVRQLNEAFAQAAGVPTVAGAVLGSMRHRGSLRTGWPMLKWLGRFRPDPLRALHLDRGVVTRVLGTSPTTPKQNELEPTAVQRTNIRAAVGVQSARIDSALRGLAADASVGLPEGWGKAIRDATLAHRQSLPDDLDRAIATTDLRMDDGHGWWGVVSVLQWVIFVVAVVGGLWLLADVVLAYMQLPAIPAPHWGRFGLPTLLLGGGLLAGLLLGLLSRAGVEAGARAKARQAERELTRRIADVADELVVAPVNAELVRHHQARWAAAHALS